MVKLAGGADALRAAAETALKEDDAQWCAELCDQLLALNPDDPAIRTLKAEPLEMLAENLLTATGRNYYLTVAQELRKPAKNNGRNKAAHINPPPAPSSTNKAGKIEK